MALGSAAVTAKVTAMKNMLGSAVSFVQTGLFQFVDTLLANLGTAATRDVGTSSGNLVELGSNGKFPSSVVETPAAATIPDASETVKGKVELADQSEVTAGTDTTRVVTPATLKGVTDTIQTGGGSVPNASTSAPGKIEIATQSEADAGTDSSRAMTPALVKRRIDASSTGGGSVPDASTTVKGKVELATPAEATAGTDTTRVITPKLLQDKIDALPSGTAPPNASTSTRGLIEISTDTEATAGTATDKAVTPKQLSDATPDATIATKGLIEIATSAEAVAGTDTTKAITPKDLKDVTGSLGAGLTLLRNSGPTIADGTSWTTILPTANLGTHTVYLIRVYAGTTVIHSSIVYYKITATVKYAYMTDGDVKWIEIRSGSSGLEARKPSSNTISISVARVYGF